MSLLTIFHSEGCTVIDPVWHLLSASAFFCILSVNDRAGREPHWHGLGSCPLHIHPAAPATAAAAASSSLSQLSAAAGYQLLKNVH